MNTIATVLQELLDLMASLRNPARGCPWDLQQDFATIVPHTIEEVYEVADAIDRRDWGDLRDELGDLLFQVVFYARLAEEAGLFDFVGVMGALVDKLRRRHPHVFGEAVIGSAEEQSRAWERQKAAERSARAAEQVRPASVLDGVGDGFPSITRAVKLQRRAAGVGFDWREPLPVLRKVQEELHELEEVLVRGGDRARLADELGDVIFATVNLSRHLRVDAENALRQAGRRFERRLRLVESTLRDAGRDLDSATPQEMEALWEAAKNAERATGGGAPLVSGTDPSSPCTSSVLGDPG